MAENSKIEWTKHTVNLWWGCTEVHAGCDHCYAKALSHRYDEGNPLWGNDVQRRMILSAFKNLNKFQKLAAEAGELHRVFMGSMKDIFEKSMPLENPKDHFTETDDLRQELFTQITWDDGLFNNLLFLFLTKRPSNISKMVPAGWLDEPPENIMYGTSLSEQENESLVGQLLKVKGKHFLSIEPQIEFITLKEEWFSNPDYKIDWVIQGGESGHGKRPFDVEWARYMRDQCKDLGVPYFFKQIDKIQEIPKDLQIREFPTPSQTSRLSPHTAS